MASLQQTGDRWNRQFVYQGKRSTLSVGKVSEAEANAKAAQVDYIFLRLKQRLITLPPGVSGGGLNDAEMTDLWDSLDHGCSTILSKSDSRPHILVRSVIALPNPDVRPHQQPIR